jgi:hypothetical protein
MRQFALNAYLYNGPKQEYPQHDISLGLLVVVHSLEEGEGAVDRDVDVPRVGDVGGEVGEGAGAGDVVLGDEAEEGNHGEPAWHALHISMPTSNMGTQRLPFEIMSTVGRRRENGIAYRS